MIEILQIAGSLGVGAFLGTFIFLMYRQEKRATEKRLTKLLEEDQDSRKENTKALTEVRESSRELCNLVKNINGRLH